MVNRARFTGKVALVTGAGSGIGEACAMALAQEGAKVLVADINRGAAARVQAAIKQAGGEGLAVQVDVTDPSSVEAMVSVASASYGGLDIAVNNAGIGGEQNPIGQYSLEGWKKVIDVNLNGVFYCMRYEIPAMQKRGGGAIVNMASILGSVGFGNSAAYVTAKHGVVGMTKNAALEYANQGIRVNSVGPGFIMTPLIKSSLTPELEKAVAAMHPMQRLGTVREVAALVCFLASDEASFVTGSYHLVDGGYVAQ
ncbi:MAG TPA: SDR family oxidoreductase [Candidatus Dormibacteraeota bacterium]|nr:SDR family oxidoreductase [Candidatus Dormibacteraeota bacterium]